MDSIKMTVHKRYSEAARNARKDGHTGCCGAGQSDAACGCDPVSGRLYSLEELAQIPSQAAMASLGCGNPTALAELRQGEVVLDLGSGGGIDVLLSARRVGPTGFAYGLDMTDEMLLLANENKARSGLTNVEFLRGEIESIPLDDASVDVIISNCVINLSTDKGRVLSEAYRVLRRGGRLAVSDIVINGEIPAAVREDLLAWAGCIAGALSIDEYADKLTQAGFGSIEISPSRVYSVDDIVSADCFSAVAALDASEQQKLDGRLWSAFIRATK